jgi:hypothetical protein
MSNVARAVNEDLLNQLKALRRERAQLGQDAGEAGLDNPAILLWTVAAEVRLTAADVDCGLLLSRHRTHVRRPEAAVRREAWTEMGIVLERTIQELELRLQPTGHAYDQGEAYFLHKDIVKLFQNAQRSVFAVDPYASADLVLIYLDKCLAGVGQTRFQARAE